MRRDAPRQQIVTVIVQSLLILKAELLGGLVRTPEINRDANEIQMSAAFINSDINLGKLISYKLFTLQALAEDGVGGEGGVAHGTALKSKKSRRFG